jgi:hypothetical protein
VTARRQAAILTQTNTYQLSRSSGQITGDIAIWIDDTPFPEARWSDFPIALLGAWLSAAGRVQRGEAHECTCYFMDGPFAFRMRAADDGMWILEPLADHRAADDPVLVPADAFMASLMAAAEAALVYSASQGWATRDLAILEATLRRSRRG